MGFQKQAPGEEHARAADLLCGRGERLLHPELLRTDSLLRPPHPGQHGAGGDPAHETATLRQLLVPLLSARGTVPSPYPLSSQLKVSGSIRTTI